MFAPLRSPSSATGARSSELRAPHFALGPRDAASTIPACSFSVRWYVASDGYRLHYRHWAPLHGPPRAQVVMLHGIQSHAGWYEHTSRQLQRAGYEVCFLDRRGSGLNEPHRGHALHASRLVNDVAHFLNLLRHRRLESGRTCRVILISCSWGGKLAAVVSAWRPELVDGLALLYPGIYSRVRPRWDQALRLDIVGRFGIRNRRVPIPLSDPALFTSRPEWQEFITRDPLTLRRVSVGFLLASRELDRLARALPEAIGCPTLLMLAGRDPIIDNSALCRWFERLGARERRRIEYPDARHTLEFETCRDQYIADLLAWLETVAV